MEPNTLITEQQQDATGEINIPDAFTSTENVLQATPQQLIEWQQADPTPKTMREPKTSRRSEILLPEWPPVLTLVS